MSTRWFVGIDCLNALSIDEPFCITRDGETELSVTCTKQELPKKVLDTALDKRNSLLSRLIDEEFAPEYMNRPYVDEQIRSDCISDRKIYDRFLKKIEDTLNVVETKPETAFDVPNVFTRYLFAVASDVLPANQTV